MLYEHLDRAQRKLYNQTLGTSHERRIHVHIQNLDGSPVSSLTPKIISGAVAHDVASDTSNSILTLSFLDWRRVVNFEPANPGGMSMHRKFMVNVVDARLIPGIGWVEQDVHTGPIWDYNRTGGQVDLTAHAVDRLAMGTVRHPRAWQRKAVKTRIIKELLRAAGAVRMKIPDLKARTSHRVTVGFSYKHETKHIAATKGHKAHDVKVERRQYRTDHYFEKAKEVADSENRHLFPDPSGVFRMRPFPERPCLHVGHLVVGDPQFGRPGPAAANEWQVIGDKPKGKKKRVQARAVLPAGNANSAQELAWNEKPYAELDRIENPHFRRTAECKAVARRHRDRAARVSSDLEFDMMPVPWLVDYDMIVVPTGIGDATVLMRQWTYPLTQDSTPMHVGTTVRQHGRPHRRAGIG